MGDDSLILKAKEQMDLIPSTDLPDSLFQREEETTRGTFTGERLFRDRPDTYRWIVSLLAEHVGVLRIGELLKVSVNTVRAVQLREGVAIDIEKKRIADLCHQGATLGAEGIVEDLADPERRRKITTKDKALVVGILVDKGQLLSGEATSRLDVQDIRVPEHDDFNRYVAGLASANTGLGAGKDGAKGASAAGAGMPGGAALEVGTDSESDGKKENNQ